MPQFFIRADASVATGMGHVMRCLTLAHALRRKDVSVSFISRDLPGNANDYSRRQGFPVHLLARAEQVRDRPLQSAHDWLGVEPKTDAAQTRALLEGQRVDWLIIDHYGIDHEWETQLRTQARRIMVIDDQANRRHDCDLLLDQNYLHDRHRYDPLTPPGCRKLLGPRYALLRDQFRNAPPRSDASQRPPRLFVCFGGADPDNVSGRVLDALDHQTLRHIEIDLVAGSLNPNLARLQARRQAWRRLTIHRQVDDIAALMRQADLGIGAGGGTTWERLAVGLPSLVITLAPNQESYSAALHADGYINLLGHKDAVDSETIRAAVIESLGHPETMQTRRQKGVALVDALGSDRVSDELLAQSCENNRGKDRLETL
jgi:UDP-2,4-diacetamido-2,4,6-trideoxy-beta-L-altropyranose hydrolase